MTAERTATCRCGQLRALCRGEPVRLSVCSCLACKRRTGSAFSFNATYEEARVETTGTAATYTRVSDEGRWAADHFCPDCGTTVMYRLEARPGRVSVPVGGFADPAFPPPTVATYGHRRESWIAFATPLREE